MFSMQAGVVVMSVAVVVVSASRSVGSASRSVAFFFCLEIVRENLGRRIWDFV